MKYKLIKIPVSNPVEFENELNGFLGGHRIICVDRQFVSSESASFWSFCIEYDDTSAKSFGMEKKSGKVDYKEVLTETEFAKFAKIREWRKAKGVELGVPVYTIFTNEHLACIAKLPELTRASIASISGIGDEKIKYFENVINCLEQ